MLEISGDIYDLCPSWRHQMETSSALLALCAGNSPVIGEFPPQRPVTRSFDGFFDLRLNNRLSKQSGGWWIETLSRPLWRHCNGQWWHAVIERLNETTIARKKCNTFNFLVSIVHAYDLALLCQRWPILNPICIHTGILGVGEIATIS